MGRRAQVQQVDLGFIGAYIHVYVDICMYVCMYVCMYMYRLILGLKRIGIICLDYNGNLQGLGCWS